jgi:hypothetical protein
MLSICFSLSLALAYFLAAALVVTAFCMNLEPGGNLIFTADDDDNNNNNNNNGAISVISVYDTDQDEE